MQLKCWPPVQYLVSNADQKPTARRKWKLHINEKLSTIFSPKSQSKLMDENTSEE
jgi:hypothetical protein